MPASGAFPIIGLCDHDSTSGVAEAMEAGARLGVEVIPGVELSSEIDGLQAHILGYFIDPESESLQREFAWMNETRRARIHQICANLNAAGISIDESDVLALSAGGTVGRPHVARVLVSNGYAESVSDAFSRFLTRGKPGYALSEKITPEGAIAAINRAGGVAVLAHPWSTKNPRAAVERLAPAGLTGVECYYGEYSPQVQNDLADLARAFGLLTTGGSDYHGEGVKTVDLGGVYVPPETVDALRDAASTLPLASGQQRRMSAAAVIVAAGTGQRFGNAGKSFAMVGGMPMAWWSLRAADAAASISEIVLVCGEHSSSCRAGVARDLRLRDAHYAGARWSATAGFGAGRDWQRCHPTVEIVAIHDAARPLVTADLFDRAVEAAQ